MPEKPFLIHALELGPMENFIYLIEDRVSGRGAVVDPAWDVGEIIALAQRREIAITDILLTHSHHDHINGIQGILDRYDAELHLLRAEAKFWGSDLERPTLHYGGERIALGGTEIEVLHTPGHTPGSACYHAAGELLTGDTLFVFGCGRCDLRGGDPEQMFHTLRRLSRELGSDTLIHPGHNYAAQSSSTMGEQIEGNPFLHFDEQEAFVDYRMHFHDRHRHTPYGPLERA
jgi:hydroxyacylglutathione hydrolase